MWKFVRWAFAVAAVASSMQFGPALAFQIQDIVDCSIEPGRDQESAHTSRDGVTFRIASIRIGTGFVQQLDLGPLDDNESWLIAELEIQNNSDEVYNTNSDNFHVRVDEQEFDEDGFESGDLNDELGLKDMGNWLGTDIEPGRSVTFGMPFEIDASGDEFALVVEDEGNAEIDLGGLLSRCSGDQTSGAGQGVTTAANPTPTPQRASTSSRSSDQTLEVFNDPQAYLYEEVVVSGDVFTIGPYEGETYILITDLIDGTLIAFAVAYSGSLASIDVGDRITVTGVVVGVQDVGQGEALPLIAATRIN